MIKIQMMSNTIKKSIKEILLYLVFGFFTTVISLCIYFFLTRVAVLGVYSANIISWVIAVLLAFFTNKKVVYKDKERTIVKAVTFIFSRVLTLGMETFLLYYGIEKLGLNDFITKFIVQVFVIVGNYLVGKLIVFRNHNNRGRMPKESISAEQKGRENSGNV